VNKGHFESIEGAIQKRATPKTLGCKSPSKPLKTKFKRRRRRKKQNKTKN